MKDVDSFKFFTVDLKFSPGVYGGYGNINVVYKLDIGF